jgi:hypothetical protein
MSEVMPLGAVKALGKVASIAAARSFRETMMLKLMLVERLFYSKGTTTYIYSLPTSKEVGSFGSLENDCA